MSNILIMKLRVGDYSCVISMISEKAINSNITVM